MQRTPKGSNKPVLQSIALEYGWPWLAWRWSTGYGAPRPSKRRLRRELGRLREARRRG